MPILSNIILFQVGWFSCVLGAAYGFPLLGVIVAISVIAIHISVSLNKINALILILLITVIGSIFDQTLLTLKLVAFNHSNDSQTLLPLWMLALWAQFATTLNISLSWLSKRRALAILFGAIGGPLAYLSAEKLGAIQWLKPTEYGLALSLGWAILMPFFFWITAKINNRLGTV